MNVFYESDGAARRLRTRSICLFTAQQHTLLSQRRERRRFLPWARRECARFPLARLRLTSRIPALAASEQWLPITLSCRVGLQQSIISAYFKWQVETFLCQHSELCGFWYKQKWYNTPPCKLQLTGSNQTLRTRFPSPWGEPLSLKMNRLTEANNTFYGLHWEQT